MTIFTTTPAAAPANAELRFVVAKDGALLTLDELPVLSSPSGEMGLQRIDTGEILLVDGTPYSLVGDSMYKVVFAEPEVVAYKYYIEVVVDGVTYYLPRTTSLVRSAMLAIGRYTTSHAVEQMYDEDNMHSWLCMTGTNRDEPVDYALRALKFIKQAEGQIDAGLGKSYYEGDGLEGDFADGVPSLIEELSTMLAGVLMYEARGVTAYDTTTNQVQHRLRWQRKNVLDTLKQLRNGVLKLDAGIVQPDYPTVGASCVVKPLLDELITDPFSIFDS